MIVFLVLLGLLMFMIFKDKPIHRPSDECLGHKWEHKLDPNTAKETGLLQCSVCNLQVPVNNRVQFKNNIR